MIRMRSFDIKSSYFASRLSSLFVYLLTTFISFSIRLVQSAPKSLHDKFRANLSLAKADWTKNKKKPYCYNNKNTENSDSSSSSSSFEDMKLTLNFINTNITNHQTKLNSRIAKELNLGAHYFH